MTGSRACPLAPTPADLSGREGAYVVLPEAGVPGDQDELLDLCLGHEHAVERVAVVVREVSPRAFSGGPRDHLKVILLLMLLPLS